MVIIGIVTTEEESDSGDNGAGGRFSLLHNVAARPNPDGRPRILHEVSARGPFLSGVPPSTPKKRKAVDEERHTTLTPSIKRMGTRDSPEFVELPRFSEWLLDLLLMLFVSVLRMVSSVFSTPSASASPATSRQSSLPLLEHRVPALTPPNRRMGTRDSPGFVEFFMWLLNLLISFFRFLERTLQLPPRPHPFRNRHLPLYLGNHLYTPSSIG